MKRIFLFLLTNALVITTISIIINALGLHSYLSAHGINYTQLAVFCGIWGMGGAFISLFLSKFIAKMSMGVVTIDPNRTGTAAEQALVSMVRRLAQAAGLRSLPEIGIYYSPELNAFATGFSRNHALVAVSSGLLASTNPNELEAVLGHEISHVANGDMVTMTLIQGVINAFSMFLSRVIAYVVSTALAARSSSDSEETSSFSTLTYSLLTVVFDVLFTILGSIVVAAFSRWREYRADAGSARLLGSSQPMIAALQTLQRSLAITAVEQHAAPALAALKIAQRPSWLALFSSHPPFEKRIARLLAINN